MNTPLLRPATPADVPAIVGLIRELAVFEKLEHLVVVTPESLLPQLFGLMMPPSQAGLVGGALASMLIYIVMAVVLAVRPQGLFPAAKG